MTNTASDNTLRWYDRYDNISIIARAGVAFPRKTQEQIGEQFLEIIKPYKRFAGESKHLGADVILRLNKGMAKNRWYDKVPSFNKAFRAVNTLPEILMYHLDLHCEELALQVQQESRMQIARPPKKVVPEALQKIETSLQDISYDIILSFDAQTRESLLKVLKERPVTAATESRESFSTRKIRVEGPELI